MQTLSSAPTNLLEIIVREGGLNDLAQLSASQKGNLFSKLSAVTSLASVPAGGKGAMTATLARSLCVSPQAVHRWVGEYARHGFRALIDRRRDAGGNAVMPPPCAQWITSQILNAQRGDGVREVRRQCLDRWNLWRRTGDPQWLLPGYVCPPPDCGKGYPDGWSEKTFQRLAPSGYQAALTRQGTITAARLLPSIMRTRVGSSYLQTIFFDDQKYDTQVRVLGYEKPMVPLGFNALDRLTAFPFRPHIRLRWYDCDSDTHKSLTQREFVWYVITILMTEGYRTDEKGTTLVQEHGTAKTWSNKTLATPDGFHSFEDAVSALTSGHVTMDDSGLFNKPAFSEMLYGPQSSGNPRFKAPIESFFHLVRTYFLPMIGQTGLDPEHAPEENYGIDQYERRMLKAANDLPTAMREGILSNYLTGVEFGHLSMLAYDALANRTDHHLEGWEKCGFVEPVWRWKDDAPGTWRSRRDLASLPSNLRAHALHEQGMDPLLTSVVPWSPAVARAHCMHDPCIARLKFTDALHLLPTTWAKAVKVRTHHEIHLKDDLLPGEELIYLPELTTPRGRKEYLSPGDELRIYINPLAPDTALVCDQSFAFLGTIARNIRITQNGDQLDEMFRQRGRLKAAMEGPARRAMEPAMDRRAAVRDLNADLIAAARNVTPPSAITPAPSRPATGNGTAADKAMDEMPEYADESHTDDLDF